MRKGKKGGGGLLGAIKKSLYSEYSDGVSVCVFVSDEGEDQRQMK